MTDKLFSLFLWVFGFLSAICLLLCMGMLAMTMLLACREAWRIL